MFEKDLWKSDILSKDAGRWPASLLKMSLFHRCFSNILLVKTNYWFLNKWDIGRKCINSRFTVTEIISQRKTFYKQRVTESSCARKKNYWHRHPYLEMVTKKSRSLLEQRIDLIQVEKSDTNSASSDEYLLKWVF